MVVCRQAVPARGVHGASLRQGADRVALVQGGDPVGIAPPLARLHLLRQLHFPHNRLHPETGLPGSAEIRGGPALMSRLLGIGIVAALVLVGILTWAGQQRPPDRYLDAIKARDTLRVGLDPSYPPFESLSNGQYAGHDIDLARAIAPDLGVQVEFKPFALDTQYDALASDQVDMLISALPFI